MEQDTEFQFNYAQSTDVGCVRELNEDSIFSQSGLWLVADGMGGHACGEIASAMAVKQVSECFVKHGSLDNAIQSAHREIIEAGRDNLAQSGMGTTIVAMVGDALHYQIAWVGDSRAYLWDTRLAKLVQISEDHSLMVRLINAGLITTEDAVTHPQRHMITQCLGSTEIETVKVDIIERDWDCGQQILLCSDGLTDEVSDLLIAETMGAQMSLKEKADTLINTAKQSGGRDNISLIIVESPSKRPVTFIQKIRNLFGW
jgi:serine/threonine protein phosphatase PrpC